MNIPASPGQEPADASFRVLVVLYSLDESLDRSGIASDFDDLGFFDFVEM